VATLRFCQDLLLLLLLLLLLGQQPAMGNKPTIG
jgi:hypothetical protein